MRTPFIAIANFGTTKAGFNHLISPTFVVIEGETDKNFYGRALFNDSASYAFRFKKSDVRSLKESDLADLEKKKHRRTISFLINDFIWDYIKIWEDKTNG